MTSAPHETAAQHETSASHDTSEPYKTSGPYDTSASSEISVPYKTSGPHESSAPYETSWPHETSASNEFSAPPDLKTVEGERDPAEKEYKENRSSKKKSNFPLGIVAGAVGGALALIVLAVFVYKRQRSRSTQRIAVAGSTLAQEEAMRNLG